MLSRTLVRLIDQAILPAILLLATRVVSVLAASKMLGINLTVTNGGFVFASRADYVAVNSYSIASMIIALALGNVFILLKAMVFHDTHITPFVTARLFSLRLSSFIQSSFEIYSQAFMWVAYSYLMLIVTFYYAFTGHVENWVFIISLILVILQTVFFVSDIESEIEIRKNEDKYIEDETYIEETKILYE